MSTIILSTILKLTKRLDMRKVVSEVTGSVWKIEVQVGQSVSEDETLVIVESMKMEIPIGAPCSGVVDEVFVAEGEAVSEGQIVALIN
jgi:acetyl-CoA carboxylase biotin carboxyl carrier protein